MNLKNKIDIHHLQFFIFGCGIAALGISYFLQYVFLLVPCELCIYARQVWKIITVFAFLGAVIPPVTSVPRLNSFFYYLSIVLLTISTGLGVAHFGIEQHWWQDFVASCSVDENAFMIQDSIVKSCADADYIHIGNYIIRVSVTMLSLIYSGFVLFLSIVWRSFNNFKKNCQSFKI